MFDTESAEAVQALLDRGVNAPEQLARCGTPEQILAVCHRWDRQTGVTPGLLVRWIRDRDFDEHAPAASSRPAPAGPRFGDYARRYSVGSVAEPHATLQQRCGHDDEPCSGDMVVVDLACEQLTASCDRCGYGVAYTLAALRRALPLEAETPAAQEWEF